MKGIQLLIAASLLIASAAMAAVPNQMNVQGRLLNAGDPMIGSHPAIFSIYDAATGGNLLWTESSSLVVQGGIFTATLGLTTSIPTLIFSNQPRWLEVTVDGNTLNPRLPLVSNAYAFRAQRADTADVALSNAGSEIWSTNGTYVWRLNGTVGIGTDTPIAKLDIRNGDMAAGPTGEQWIFHTRYGVGNGDYLHITDQDAGGDWKWDKGLVIRPQGSIGLGTTDPLATAWFGDPAIVAMGNRPTLSLRTTAVGGHATMQFVGPTAGSHFHLNFVDGSNPLLRLRSYTTNTDIFTLDGYGNLTLAGALNVAGAKCRIVKTPSGELKVNAVESAHALFMDDEPSARLVNGQCRVNLSPKFLATVTVNGKYPLAVNVTFYGRHGGEWYVERDDAGFTVIDPSGSNAEFSWQAIARQRDYEDANLDPVTQTAAK